MIHLLPRPQAVIPAITVSNKISEELGWGIYDEYVRYGYYILNEYVQYPGDPIAYGVFPAEYLPGLSNILSSYGSKKHIYYSMRGN